MTHAILKARGVSFVTQYTEHEGSGRLEHACEDTQQAADAVLAAAKDLIRAARQLHKSASEGTITGIKRAQGRLDQAEGSLQQAIAGAKSWPFRDDEEERYLTDGYAAELRLEASRRGMSIREQDGRLISYPHVVRVLPAKRAVRVDRKQVAAIRPSHLVDLLHKGQQKDSGHRSPAFLEALYRVYSEIVGKEPPDQLIKGDRPVVRLALIYRLFTSLPGAQRDYTTTDFARDLYLLDASGPRHTRNGAVVSFPSSTGARASRDTFPFVGRDGQEARYYGIKFTEAG